MMDKVANDIRKGISWIMMFTHDILICRETKEHVEESIVRWRHALKRNIIKSVGE